MPSTAAAKGWVKPELRVSIIRVKHLKDTGVHAVEVQLDGQESKRTAWVGNDGELDLRAWYFVLAQMVTMIRSSIGRQASS